MDHPHRITDADTAVPVETATTRPRKHGLPFTHWSVRKLADYLSGRYGVAICGRRFIARGPGRTPTTPDLDFEISESMLARTDGPGDHFAEVEGAHPARSASSDAIWHYANRWVRVWVRTSRNRCLRYLDPAL